MVINMTLVLQKEQLKENFSIDKLLSFSKRNNAKIIVRKYCKIEYGIITWMSRKLKKEMVH